MADLPLLPTTPSEAGLDARGVLRLLDALEADPVIDMHSLMVLRHGRVLAQGWWAPYTPERVHLLYSLSKTFTATALSFAIAEGLVSLEDRVVDHFPELSGAVTDHRTRTMLVRHLASMATGHLDDTWGAALAADHDEPVRGFLGLPPERDPGTVFAYNQPATYTLAALLQRRTGGTLVDYLRPRLLDPLGIGEVAWQQHPTGRDLGFSGLHGTTDAVARLGQLLLQDGVWRGEQLLPEGWVAQASRAHVSTRERPGGVDWQQGYGFQVWRSRHGFRGDGAYGQFCLVLPEQDVVVATTAATEAMQAVLDHVWTHLLPAVDRDSTPAADRELEERLGALQVPVHDGPAAPPQGSPEVDGSYRSAGGRCVAQSSLAQVEVRTVDGGWEVTLVERTGGASAETRLEVRATHGRWSSVDPEDGVPLSASGGWDPDGRLELRLRFLETPHELVVLCDPQHAAFDARWVTAPLGGSLLRHLRAPWASRSPGPGPDGRADGQPDGQTDGQLDGRADGRVDGRTGGGATV